MKNIFLLISLLFCLNNNAQKTIPVKKKIIEINTDRKKGYMVQSIKFNDKIYILYRSGYGRKSNFVLKKYDNKMKLIKEEELSFDNKENDYYGFMEYGGNLIVLLTHDDKKENVYTLFCQEVDSDKLKIKSSVKTLYSSEYKTRNKILPAIETSRDKNSMLISYSVKTKSKEDEIIGFKSFDKQLNEIISKEITLAYVSKYASLYDKEIDEKGNIYFVVRHKDEEEKRLRYDYTLYSHMANSEETKSFDLSLDEDIISDIKLVVSKQGELLASGFYSGEKEGGIKGAFFSKLDIEQQKITRQNKKEIAIDLLKKGESERTKKKIDRKKEKGKELELWGFNIDEIVLREDGGAVLIAEKFYTYTTTYTDSKGNMHTVVHYVYGDIIVVSINPKGEIDWVDKILKKQDATGTSFSSYALKIIEDRMYFVFNDDYKNHEKTTRTGKSTDGQRRNFDLSKKKGISTIYELNSEGYTKKEILTTNKEIEGRLTPLMNNSVGDNNLIIFIQSKKPKVAYLTFE